MRDNFFKDLKKEVFEIKDGNPHLAEDSAFVAWFLRAFIYTSRVLQRKSQDLSPMLES